VFYCSLERFILCDESFHEGLSLEEGKEVRASFKATAVTVITKGES
jgi:molybdopterin-binding protein